VLGYVRVTVPATAHSGQSYTLRFANADGSPDLQTQYDFETKSASLWVLSPALHPAAGTSDEWKAHFFASSTSDLAADNADPDHDGVPNWSEYLAGTDPTDAKSFLHLQGVRKDSTSTAIAFNWLSAPGKTYRVETSPSLSNGPWTVLANDLIGDGKIQQWIQTNPTASSQFYRIALQP
jgi:hypothetical protein